MDGMDATGPRDANDSDVAARARRIGELQRGPTWYADERAIRDIFLATTGDALAALKDAIDSGTSYRDLHQLVFHDIDDGAIRAEILAHFRAEAAARSTYGFKTLSDIDDTFYANWKDRRYPKKTVYPGVIAFYRALGGGLVFVSARPGDRGGLVESAALASLRKRGIDKCTVLCGAFSHLVGNDRIAAQKYENFVQFHALYPDHRFVFIGDSGQGDIAFGEKLLAHPSESVRAVFIHDVVATPEPRRRELGDRRIHLFDTYTGAAVAAHACGVLAAEEMLPVARAATDEMARIPFSSNAQRAARLADLANDIARMNALLPASHHFI
ncbi:phosphatase domain-containing protein [Pendulispora albinea]|uniref:Phosphatidate phosphatase APP1 catalytic domain-containing protein n=1 Tax=Pendulispora albinea TaxID=2741071 RepID=A0ABZ2LVL5_9BACT